MYMSLDAAIARFQGAVRTKAQAQSDYNAAFERHMREGTKQAWSAKMAALSTLTACCTEANAAERSMVEAATKVVV